MRGTHRGEWELLPGPSGRQVGPGPLCRRLSHLRERSKLRKQTQPVNAVPVLDDLSVGDPHHVDDVNFDFASGWCDALKLSQMGTRITSARLPLVNFEHAPVPDVGQE